jgi:DNA invertase Pin-like site-specific DNA recombinase
MLVGYARVSSAGQSLDIQEEALRQAGCERLFSEKRSGTTATGREELERCLSYLREGDALVVTRLDRLARSVGDLFGIIDRLQAKAVQFRCLQQSGVDTDTSSGRLMLAVLGAVAAFETDIRRERQMEGIAKAKEAGVYKGRKPTVDAILVRELHQQGCRPSQIAATLGIGRASVYRAIAGSLQPSSSAA